MLFCSRSGKSKWNEFRGYIVNSGISPLSYFWNTGETLDSISPQSNGIYWLVVVDSNMCMSDTVYFTVTNVPTAVNEVKINKNKNKNIIQIVDVLGRETPFKKSTPLFYIYNDGTVEKEDYY